MISNANAAVAETRREVDSHEGIATHSLPASAEELEAPEYLTTREWEVGDGIALVAAPPQRFNSLTPIQVISQWQPPPGIVGLTATTGIMTIFGKSGAGKSFVCLHLAAMLALGQPWFGRAIPLKRRVVYVALEGQGGMSQRLRAWTAFYQQEFPGDVRFVFEPLAINREEEVVLFSKWIEQIGGTDVIIIDTLNRAAPGADENRSADMGKIIAGASLLQKNTDSLVILVHHSGKDESRGLRGHSSLYAALDVVIEVKRDASNKRWWQLEKAKDGEDGISHAFDLELVDLGLDTYGYPVTSVAMRELEGSGPTTQKQQTLGKNQLAVLVRFKLLMAGLSITEPDGPTGVTYADCVLHCKECVEVKDARHRTERVKEALNSLIKSGHIAESGGLLTLPS